MKERPIIFSSPMVQAILRDAKTQTRRAIKGAPEDAGCAMYSQPWQQPGTSSALFFEGPTPKSRSLASVKCPYGVPGDRLWVRETFFCNRFDYPDGPRDELKAELYYAADGLPNFEGEESEIRWRPSIHMPRWASRLTLEITGVRVERLQTISQADALAEGVTSLNQDWVDQHWPEYAARRNSVQATNAELEAQGESMGFTRPPLGPTPRERFQALWEDINGTWQANPWLWVVEFEQVTA